jgi:hypothetical protein
MEEGFDEIFCGIILYDIFGRLCGKYRRAFLLYVLE